MRRADPSRNRIARLLGDLKLHRPLRLLLHDHRARGDMTALDHIINKGQAARPEAPTENKRDLDRPDSAAVDGEVELCKFSGSMIQLRRALVDGLGH